MYRPFLRVASATAIVLCLLRAVSADIDTTVADLPAFMAPNASKSLLLDGVAVGGKLFVVGEHGHILLSTDNGESWTQQNVPTRSALTGVYFVDENTGWAVGHDAIILKTTDGGTTWKKVYFDPLGETPLLDVWFGADGRGIAVGAYGLYLETTDGGETWARRPFFSQKLPVADGDPDANADEAADDEDDFVDPEYGEDFHLNHITAADSGMLYIAAELGRVYRSTDGGQVWYRLPVGYGGSFFATLPLQGDTLLLAGMRGNLFRSEDGGLSFEQIDSGTEALIGGGVVLDPTHILLGASAGALLESTDGGRTFTLHGQKNRKGIMTVLATNADAVILIGEAGVTRLTPEAYKGGGE